MTPRQQYERAFDQGRQARSVGRPTGSNPFRGNTGLVRDLAQEWLRGWQERDAEIRGERRR